MDSSRESVSIRSHQSWRKCRLVRLMHQRVRSACINLIKSWLKHLHESRTRSSEQHRKTGMMGQRNHNAFRFIRTLLFVLIVLLPVGAAFVCANWRANTIGPPHCLFMNSLFVRRTVIIWHLAMGLRPNERQSITTGCGHMGNRSPEVGSCGLQPIGVGWDGFVFYDGYWVRNVGLLRRDQLWLRYFGAGLRRREVDGDTFSTTVP